MPHAFILGGTGQIGQAAAEHLLDSGWSVTVAHRGPRSMPSALVNRGAKVVLVDRKKPNELARALSSGADALIDAIAYEPEHARQLLEIQGGLGSMIVVSSSSVYRDEVGRTLDEAAETGFPKLPEPITEGQITVDPGLETYSTRKVAIERILLDQARVPVTILRPGAISGPGSEHAREWWFVKRILDNRPFIPLAYGGQSRLHYTSVTNIAALARVVACLPGQRILNIADPTAPSVSEIGDRIAQHFGFAGRIIRLPDVDAYPPVLGRSPWSIQHPFVLDTAAARALGYMPQSTFDQTVATVCEWLRQSMTGRDWRALLPVLASYRFELFDYALEDNWFSNPC